jgi:PAS domain S-box-containing protein
VQTELSRVVDTLPGLVWTALADGRIDFLNQRWCEYTGVSIEEACGWGWQTAIYPGDLPEFLEHWGSILASAEPGEIEARLRRFDGEYRWFLFRIRPLAEASGQVTKWCGINDEIKDWRCAEKPLGVREDRFRSIVDGIPSLVTISTPAGELEFANRQVLEYFCATLEELKNWAPLVHPDDRSRVLASCKHSVETGASYDIEHRIRRADGVYRWFHMHGFPLRDPDGRIGLWYVLHSDIDDRKRAESLLAGQKALLEAVISGSPLPDVLDALCKVVDSTAEGCFTSLLLLDRTGTKVGFVAAPGLPSEYKQFLESHPVDCAGGPCGMAIALNTEVIVSDVAFDTRWERGSFPTVALACGIQSCWSSPIRSSTGEVLGSFAITNRQTGRPTPFHQVLMEQFTHMASIAIERTRSEEALKRSEALLAKAQRLSATGSFCWRAETDDIKWSQEAYRIFEFDPAVTMMPELIRTRVHPEDVPLFDEIINRARGTGSDFEYEHRLEMPDRSVKYLHVVAHGTKDQEGRVEYIGAIQDMTQRRLSEETLSKTRSELAHVARAMSLGALTASIAHEVNQPLSGIITNASTCLRMLDADPPDLNGARETARRTLRDGNRASDVITRLRALFGKKGVTSDSVDLNEATREVIALSRSELQRSRVTLRTELADGLPAVTGDRVQLQQVILNLLLNASDAMSGVHDRSRRLMIRTEREGEDHVRLTVQDVGIGFDGKDVDRLFEAFYTTKTGGMGIGLSVSRSIIESHHGRLWAAPNDGPGATFSFSIPCVQQTVKGSRNLDATRTLAVANSEHL